MFVFYQIHELDDLLAQLDNESISNLELISLVHLLHFVLSVLTISR